MGDSFSFTKNKFVETYRRISSDISLGREENRGEEKEGKN